MIEEIFSHMMIPSLISGVSFAFIGAFMYAAPPGEINGLVGYRTSSSMKSQERWDFAQKYSAKLMQYIGGIMVILSGLSYFIPVDTDTKQIAGIVLLVASAIVLITLTEMAIRKRFKDK
ncbi:MAG: SdpI family protein [Flavobacterium sp.]